MVPAKCANSRTRFIWKDPCADARTWHSVDVLEGNSRIGEKSGFGVPRTLRDEVFHALEQGARRVGASRIAPDSLSRQAIIPGPTNSLEHLVRCGRLERAVVVSYFRQLLNRKGPGTRPDLWAYVA